MNTIIVLCIVIITINVVASLIKLLFKVTLLRILFTLAGSVIVIILIMTINSREENQDIKEGAYYHVHCRLLEKNVSNGVFMDKTDKAICDGVITHLPAGHFEQKRNRYLDFLKDAKNDKGSV